MSEFNDFALNTEEMALVLIALGDMGLTGKHQDRALALGGRILAHLAGPCDE